MYLSGIMNTDNPLHPETACVHGTYDPFDHRGARAMPIYQSAAYCYESADQAASLFAFEEEGNIYSRLGTPTTDEAENRVALLEGGIGAVSFASGMAALSAFVFNFLKSGDHIAAASSLYGGSMGLLTDTLPRVGIETSFFDPLEPASLEAVMRDSTRLVLAENLANPTLSVPDHAGLSAVARAHRVPYLVDNTFATPLLCRPAEFGADFVLHSTTKYMMGHGDAIGGMIVDSGTFDFDPERYPLMFDIAPDGRSYAASFGKKAFLTRLRGKALMNLGGCMAPFHAWLLLRGLESLHVRYERHLSNALFLADALARDARVAWVNHPSRSDHPSRANADRYLGHRYGAVVGFGLAGGYEACKRFIDRVRLISHTTNIGDTKTLVIHPASTTHRNMGKDARAAAGIGDDFIRMSVGLEHPEDLLRAIEAAL
jgi:O-acetylhomoserine (thiol)-lyase